MDNNTLTIAADLHVWREIRKAAQTVLDPKVGYGSGDHEAMTKRAIFMMQEAAVQIIKLIPEAAHNELDKPAAAGP